MNNLTDIERRFAAAAPRLRARRRRLVQAILESPDETFHLSSHQMARRYSVDPATIVRTVQALGYGRFADFSSDLRKHFVSRITPYTVMKATASERRSVADYIRQAVERDLESLHLLAKSLDIDQVKMLARRIIQARRVTIVGIDMAASLSSFLAYALQVLGVDAEAPAGSAGNLFHHVKHMGARDLLVAISFRRGLRDTLQAVITARAHGVPTFGITDSPMTPIARYCDMHLLAPISSPSFTGSYVAPMALMNAIVLACAHQNPARSLAFLRENEAEYNSGARWFKDPAAPHHRSNGGSGIGGHTPPRRSSRRRGRT